MACRSITLEDARTEPALKFASYGNERLDPGQEATQSVDVEFPVEALKANKLKEIRLELAYIPSPYREETISFAVSRSARASEPWEVAPRGVTPDSAFGGLIAGDRGHGARQDRTRRSAMKWLMEFYNERQGMLARYGIEAPLPAEAVRLGQRAVLLEYPSTPRRSRLSLFERAERAGGQDTSGWVLYRIVKDSRHESPGVAQAHAA